jgi:hypothetical protein
LARGSKTLPGKDGGLNRPRPGGQEECMNPNQFMILMVVLGLTLFAIMAGFGQMERRNQPIVDEPPVGKALLAMIATIAVVLIYYYTGHGH